MRTLILLLCCALGLSAAQPFDHKAQFDITLSDITQTNTGEQSLLRIPYPGVDYVEFDNELLHVVILKDGFFTIGTTAGLDPGVLDDDCQITFGHPYALTSYPIILLDGEAYKPNALFLDNPVSLWTNDGTEAGIELLSDGLLEFHFDIQQNAETLLFSMTIWNRDTLDHNLDLGCLLDPALGKWGDGRAYLNDVPLREATLFEGNVPDAITVQEREGSPAGIKIRFQFDGDPPASLELNDWFSLSGIRPLELPVMYDLALQLGWSAADISPGESLHHEFVMVLEESVFPTGPFMRSQLPYFLSVENNLLFPRTWDALTQIYNNSSSNSGSLELQLTGSYIADPWTSDEFNLAGYQTRFVSVPMQFPENYQDQVIPVQLNLYDGSISRDELVRDVLIPATPFSDTGLVVEIDTLFLDSYPEVSMRFQSRIEETGQLLLDLGDENIFLYEDDVMLTTFDLIKDTTGGVNSADIVFVLDVTGSMGNEIDHVADNVIEFADSMNASGVDFRLAMVTFLDQVENVYDFTADVPLFQGWVAQQYAHGGGDIPENSLEALYAASQLQFRDEAMRIFIWITDANYHQNNSNTDLDIPEIIDILLMHSVVTHAIGPEQYRIEYYDPIVNATSGSWFDINGNFRDILLEISRLEGSSRYLLSYQSEGGAGTSHQINLDIHYAGLGGSAELTYMAPSYQRGNPGLRVACFPNPFNPEVTIRLANERHLPGTVTLYNVLGQQCRQFHIDPGPLETSITWDATDAFGRPLGSGVYFMQVQLVDPSGINQHTSVYKLVHNR